LCSFPRSPSLMEKVPGVPVQMSWPLPLHYKVRDKIGTGSYGYVCEAFNTRTNQNTAIKKISKVFDDLIDCKRILREIAILNRLNNQGIVKLMDLIIPSGSFSDLYIVLELCDSDLKKLCRMEEYLTELHIKTLLYNLSTGVLYLQSAGILHRDLKPANCLVNKDCTLKICDFGLSRAIGMDFQSSIHLPVLPHTPREGEIEGTLALKRQLTGHVCTRWYRAPELILLEENYSESIDIWSVGCIFAELLGMLKDNVPIFSERSPLFPGSSCFPLSPDNKHATDYKYHTKGNRDQLNVIFNILGTPNEEDIDAIEKPDAKRYLKCFTPRIGSGLQVKFNSNEQAVDLLSKMLIFNPKKRINIYEILQHPYLKEVRKPELEIIAKQKISLQFELEPELGQDQLRKYFIEEMNTFN
jgi:mitogen-activated protein kinase 1/3